MKLDLWFSAVRIVINKQIEFFFHQLCCMTNNMCHFCPHPAVWGPHNAPPDDLVTVNVWKGEKLASRFNGGIYWWSKDGEWIAPPHQKGDTSYISPWCLQRLDLSLPTLLHTFTLTTGPLQESCAVAEMGELHDNLSKFWYVYQNLQWHRAVLPSMARLSC